MKKNILIPLVLLTIIGIGVIIINACSKSDQEKVTTPGKITHFSPSEDQVVPLITQFKQRYENHKAGYKSGGDINLGEAEWTIEAAVNYEFRGIKENLQDFVYDSIKLISEVCIGENGDYLISESNAIALYEDMLDFTSNKINEDYTLIVADVEVTEVSSGTAEVKLISVVAGSLPDPCQLYANDHWYAAANAGRCGGYSGGVGQDAADKIRILLNCSSANGYWTSVETIYDIVEYYGPSDEPCFWGMEYSGDWEDCLSPSNIDYWYDLALYVISEEEPVSKDYIDCYFTSEFLLGGGDTYFHYFEQIRYGILNEGDPD